MANKNFIPKLKDRLSKLAKSYKKLKNFVFNHWEKRPLIVNLLFSILPVTLYYLGYLDNIRENTGSIVTYVAALITLNGVFLTLLVTLKGSPIFARLKKLFPKLHDYLYFGLAKQVKSCIFFSLVNLTIALVGPIDNFWIIAAGIIVWSYYLVDVSLGAIYNLKIVTDLAIKDVDSMKPMS